MLEALESSAISGNIWQSDRSFSSTTDYAPIIGQCSTNAVTPVCINPASEAGEPPDHQSQLVDTSGSQTLPSTVDLVEIQSTTVECCLLSPTAA
ncbi:hypothetical protein MAR_036043 [Mya arenaria]|uniref:Uncharacterized protein n=1 Tax=Mya arenaria TaxID=6604 RepID=A0ABY7EPG8_MYAAR|nr:hypothetical protein MAR_036043 [Mya arenaria]